MNVGIGQRPVPGSKTGRVWEVADRLFRQTGRLPSSGAVAEAYLALDPSYNRNTAATQYSRWRRAHLEQPPQAVQVYGQHGSARLVVGAGGQVTLPDEFMSAMGVVPGQRIVAVLHDGEVLLASADTALKRAQRIVRESDTGSGSAADELIADRRREAMPE